MNASGLLNLRRCCTLRLDGKSQIAMWTGEGHTSSKCGVVIMEVLEVYNRG
jgi:hypothetical protein